MLGAPLGSPFGGVSPDSATTSVSGDLLASYLVSYGVLTDLAASYAVRGVVSSDVSGAYAINTSVAATLSASYGVLQSVHADAAASYQVRGSVAADLAGLYGMLSTIVRDMAASYMMLAGVVSDLPGAYMVHLGADSELVGSYHIVGAISGDLEGEFEIMSEVGPIISIKRILDLDANNNESEFVLRGGVWTIDTDPDDDLFYGLKMYSDIVSAGTNIETVEAIPKGTTVTMDAFVKDPRGFVGVKLSGLDLSSDEAINELIFRVKCINGERYDRSFQLRHKDK
jgi:hypothetical protein